jgi:hypothetical protein
LTVEIYIKPRLLDSLATRSRYEVADRAQDCCIALRKGVCRSADVE